VKRSTLFLSVVSLATLTASPGRADDSKKVCTDAYAQAQTLRDAHKLKDARDQLRICSQSTCTAFIVKECTTWLLEVEKGVPTVVITAKDSVGADLVDVRVSVDGQLLTTKLDGQAVAINPGSRLLHFEFADGTQLDRQVLVKEGEKNQEVAVVLSKKGGLAPAPTPASVPTVPLATPAAEGAHPSLTVGVEEGAPAGASGHAGGSGAWKALGWVLGGVGVVGMGVGTTFGILAINDKSTDCANNVCNAGTLSGLKTAALVSDIGVIGGAVLVAGGGALVLFTPKGNAEASVKVAPTWTAQGGGVVLGGRW
jgi:hypothetical protein